MLARAAVWVFLASCLVACTGSPSANGGPDTQRGVLSRPAEDTPLASALRTTPPPPGTGSCWHAETLPAVFETVTDQRVVAPREAAPGQPARPATVQSISRQAQVRPRATVWFEVPCPPTFDAAFVASLQRALKARGLYAAAITGVPDAETAAAVRRYQAPLGLDSPVLSLAAARTLGLVATGG